VIDKISEKYDVWSKWKLEIQWFIKCQK
jgi:hypothetical protein